MYRYIGNKGRLTSKIVEAIRGLVPQGARIADVMCGTATVSEALRVAGFEVVASDIMTYAVHHARVRLLLEKAPPFDGLRLGSYFEVLQHLQNLKPRHGFFYKECSPGGKPRAKVAPRMYFSSENAAKLDAISLKLSEWQTEGKTSQIENSLLRHDLILATNRVANIAGTYGHFRSKWSNSSRAPLKLQPASFIWGFSTRHEVFQGAAEDLAKSISADVCYIDPPYMKRQYAANYHIIETIARGDIPEAIGVSGLRPWRDQYSNFCTKTRSIPSFEQIFETMDCKHFVLSYSEDGLLGREVIREMLEKYGTVELHDIEFARFRSNQSQLSRKLKEYLFVMRRHSKAKLFSKRKEPPQHALGAT
jgi:adenine-specific DNA-methyltransferase